MRYKHNILIQLLEFNWHNRLIYLLYYYSVWGSCFSMCLSIEQSRENMRRATLFLFFYVLIYPHSLKIFQTRALPQFKTLCKFFIHYNILMGKNHHVPFLKSFPFFFRQYPIKIITFRFDFVPFRAVLLK